MSVHIVWLITSPRSPAGLLTARAWDLLREAETVYTAADSGLITAVREAGAHVTVLDVDAAETRLLSAGGIWLAGPDGDEALARRIAERLASVPAGSEVELVYGSWDPPGARLLDLVAVIDRLRSPQGCPWDRQQTHASLAPFLLEEAYETVDAIEAGNAVHLREELGDLLMQPLFHARFASEHPEESFDVDDVAGDAVEKMVRRHPHVFGDSTVDSLGELSDNWESIKRAEKPERAHATDGVAEAQPALSLAAKYISRVDRAGLDVPVADFPVDAEAAVSSREGLGGALLAIVAAAERAGIDAELALRAAAREYAQRAREQEDS